VAADRPLIIDHRLGDFVPDDIAGYSILAGVQSDYGYWYLYAPDAPHREEHGEKAVYLAADGSPTLPVRTERQPETEAAAELNPSIYGGWRDRRVMSSAAGVAPQTLDLYSWPADLPLRSLPDATPDVLLTSAPAERAEIVKDRTGEVWTINGQAAGRYSHLIRYAAQPLAAGTLFMARGVVEEGGITIGLLKDDQWAGLINVNREGNFLAVLRVQATDSYELVVANCIETSWWTIARRHWLQGTLGSLTGRFLPNRVRVLQAGWVTATATSAAR
jgi:hypothetical protein